MQHKTHPKNNAKHTNNHGNALVIILVMIALIAALTAVAMRSSNRSSGNMDTETSRIQAEKLMRQAKGIEAGISQMTTVNGCSENDINFVNPLTTRIYTNPTAPTSKKCNVFDLEGAGLTYSNPDPVIFDSTKSGLADYGQWVFSASHCVLQLGSDDDDTCDKNEVALMAVVPNISLPVCIQINNMVGVANTAGAPPSENFGDTSATFIGVYAAGADPELGESGGTALIKHASGCFQETAGAWSGSYIFYHMLITR